MIERRDRNPILNKLAMLATLVLFWLLGFAVLVLVTRPASFRHFAEEVAAGRHVVEPIAEVERKYWRPTLNPAAWQQIDGYRIVVKPLWYDPEPIDVVCLRVNSARLEAFLVGRVKSMPRPVRGLPFSDYHARQFQPVCNKIQPDSAPPP